LEEHIGRLHRRVSCAGGNPQNGLMGPWAPISDAFAGAPAAPIAVQPWGDHFAFFATDATGAVMTAGGDPQNGLVRNALAMTELRALSALCLSDYDCFSWSKVSSADLHVVESTFEC
jgi:hypothetical protein